MCVNWTKWTRITRATPAEQNTVLRRKVVHPCEFWWLTGVGLKASCCCEVCGSRDAATVSPLCLSPGLHCCCSSHYRMVDDAKPTAPKMLRSQSTPCSSSSSSVQERKVHPDSPGLPLQFGFVCLSVFNSFCVLQRRAFQPWISTWKATAELQLQRCCRLLVVVKV